MTNLAPGYHDVDLVKENGTYIFYFVNDGLYTRLPEAAKHQDPHAILRDARQGAFPGPNCTATTLAEINNSRHVIELVCQWLWAQHIRFGIFDVGSHAGRFAIEIGNYVRYCCRQAPIVAFEPGHTCDLIRYSVELNGLTSLVEVREVALSDVDGPLLFAESDKETNASSIWRKAYHDRTTVVRSVSLETALGWVPDIDHLIMKLDVEGAEPMLLDELARLRSRCRAVVVCEIVPWRFGGWPQAAQYLQRLADHYHLINIHSFLYNYTMKRVAADDIATLMEEVAKRPTGFTDMLLIPRDLEGAADLVGLVERLDADSR